MMSPVVAIKDNLSINMPLVSAEFFSVRPCSYIIIILFTSLMNAHDIPNTSSSMFYTSPVLTSVSHLCVPQPEPEATSEEEEQEASLRQYFRQLAGDDMEIDAFELQEVLNSVFQRGIMLNWVGG